MPLQIAKRTRITVNTPWNAWAITTDAPPYTNTDLIEYRVYEDTDIDINDLTNGSIIVDADDHYIWSGTGVFDIMMMAVNSNVKIEHDEGRITGTNYADVYLGAIQSTIENSLQFLLQEQNNEAKTDVAIEQKELLKKQQALTERQTQGFDDDAKQKLLKQVVDGWSVAYSVSQDDNSIPDSIKVNVIDSIMKNAYGSLGVEVTNDPIGET